MVFFMTIFIVLVTGCTEGIFQNSSSPSNTMREKIPEDNLHINETVSGENAKGYPGSTGKITINAVLPESSREMGIYHGYLREGDAFIKAFQPLANIRKNVTSEHDAPVVAKNAMIPFGGLPDGAIFVYAETSYLEEQRPSTGEVVNRWPVMTTVFYGRRIHGMSIAGDSDNVVVDLGENGEVLRIQKRWRSIEYTGYNATIIPASEAIKKLLRGGTIESAWIDDNESVIIKNIELAYNEGDSKNPDIVIEPVWIFSGTTSSQHSIEFLVNARQSATISIPPIVTPHFS